MDEVPPPLLPAPEPLEAPESEPEEPAVPEPLEPLEPALLLLLPLLPAGLSVPDGVLLLLAELPGLPVPGVEPEALPEEDEVEEGDDAEEPVEPLLPWVLLPLPEPEVSLLPLLEEPCCCGWAWPVWLPRPLWLRCLLRH